MGTMSSLRSRATFTAAVTTVVAVTCSQFPGIGLKFCAATQSCEVDGTCTSGAFQAGDSTAANPSAGRPQEAARVWSVEELALHDGSDPSKPVLLSILGEVFDVSHGKQHYGKDMGYSYFAGRDCSRCFASGNDEEGDDPVGASESKSRVLDLPQRDLSGIFGWRSFYKEHEKYQFVGYLADRYYDSSGRPTMEHAQLEVAHAASGNADEMRKALRERFKGCNTKYVGGQPYTEVWCDDEYHGNGARPMHVYTHLPFESDSIESESNWCTCLRSKARKTVEAEAAKQLVKPQHGKPTFRLVDYPECMGKDGKFMQHCERPHGAKPP